MPTELTVKVLFSYFKRSKIKELYYTLLVIMDNFKLSKVKMNKARFARNLFSILNYVKCSLENEVWDYGQDKNYLVTSEV